MGNAIKTLVSMQVPFALKGGGHMPTPGFNNINSSGVLLSSSGFKQLEISADGKTVHVGPGNIWDDVYQYLEPYGCTVVGGRLGIVGIP
jgi:FAD/FMN-containing dehydrogenase